MTNLFRIAFVDDEPSILRGIRRTLTDMEDEWDMVFCSCGEETLAQARQRQFDVVVSDMRMPGMDGAKLLEAIRALHPATIRIILSGYSEADTVLRTVGPAHIYLAKPCDSATLRAAIGRQVALRALLGSQQLQATLAGLTSLPSLPRTYIQLQSELFSPFSSIKAVADIIARDVAMTAEILKLTNSAYFSAAGRVSTPLQAVRLLGMETIQALVLKIGVFRQFSGTHAVAPLLEALTFHSLALAELAECIAITEGADVALAKSAQIAAMLSDIGSVVLLDSYPDEYRTLLADAGPELPLHVAETKAFGAAYPLIGAYLLGLWGFSDTIVEAVAYACTPSGCPGRDNLVLTAVHAALVLGPPSPLLPGNQRSAPEFDMAYLTEAGRQEHVRRWRDLATHRQRKA